MPLLECVANVSEGRRADTIAACADAIRATGAWLLDVSSDPSHHRTVYTFAAPPSVVVAGAVALADCAIARIDLRSHAGVHPRVGAVDVIPFVPLDGATMSDAIAAARACGRALADRFQLPVFLYGEAATVASRVRLEEIRRGQFEGLAEKLARPEWTPDFGPAVPHRTAGAAVVGARDILVAYNVNLASTDLAVAKKIAEAVRERSGGLPFVKAMGLALPHRSLTQVSMNLTNVRVTSIVTVFDAVSRAANRVGAQVLESEIVGLVPAWALTADDAAHIQLAGERDRFILEQRLASVPSGSATTTD